MKKTLYWCPECNVPLLGRGCAAGHEGQAIALLEPYDVRPALAADHDLVDRSCANASARSASRRCSC